ncbi:MAG: DUF308 domain-containing protein [Eubacteriales bacterium]|nr:DUF308 domain-containing protein [Eubacteriales bacterium]
MNPEDNNSDHRQQRDYESQQDYHSQQDFQQQHDYYSQQNYRETQYDGQDYTHRNGRNPSPVSGMSIAALILGSLSVLTSCCGIGGIIFGALGIIIAMMSKGREPMQTNTKIGLGLSVAGLIFSLIFGIIIIAGLYLYSTDTSEGSYWEYDYYEGQPYFDYEYPGGGYQYIPYEDNLNDLTEQYERQNI